ncbi:hypothetical protein ACJD0Z_00460 [Flavobacteriaceae bacterium M23B6Z8]
MKNKNLKKLANQLLSDTCERKDLEIIKDSDLQQIVGGLESTDIVEADACEDRFKCRNGFSCQTF